MLTETQIQRMLRITSEGLAPPLHAQSACDSHGGELQRLLIARNGFVAFESALHVFPCGCDRTPSMTLETWNSPTRWKSAYAGMADSLHCFAEDIFGNQFAVSGGSIVSFDPETGESVGVARDLGDWIDLVLADYPRWTGYQIAHLWQRQYGALALPQRLAPKIPFVLGGSFDISNPYAVDATEGMLVRANLAVQIRDLPDGTEVEYVVTS